MKKTVGLFILFAVGLLAADFWQKPYMEWSDKDLTKMMTSSPWAKSTGVALGGPGGALDPGAAGPGGGGGGRGGGPQGGAGRGGDDGGAGSVAPAVEIVARWQTALPIRQAFVRLKFGAEADKSDDAKKVLEQQEDKPYEIVLTGAMGGFLRGSADESAKALSEVTFLSSSKSGAIKPIQIAVGKPGRSMDVLFVFPRTRPFTLDDKEVEFTTKLGTSNVKIKFKLKDMVVNGKLEM